MTTRTTFDPTQPNSLAPYINKNDREVFEFLERVSKTLASQGEYDQEDMAVLEWDDAEDLLSMARLCWTYLVGPQD